MPRVEDAARRHAPPRALDVAGGAGRHAIWLAGLGWDVTLVDRAGAGVALARRRAEAGGVEARVSCLVGDLSGGALPPDAVDAGPFDLVLCLHYLNPALWPALRGALATEGVLIAVQPTLRNLERHDRPGRRFLLEPGQMLAAVQGLELLHHVEDWTVDGRHEAVVAGRRGA